MTSFLIDLFGRVLTEKPATRLPLGIKQTGLCNELRGFSLTENTDLSSALAGPLVTLISFYASLVKHLNPPLI